MLRYTVRIAALLTFASIANGATIEAKVNGLVCSFCAQGISKTFHKNPAVADVIVSLENRLVAVITKGGQDISDDEVTRSLRNAGYDVKAIVRTDRTAAEIRKSLETKQ